MGHQPLALMIALAPLVPLILIFLLSKFDIPPLNLLALVCLIGLVKALAGQLPALSIPDRSIARNVCTLLELVALVQLFKSVLDRARRVTVNLCMTALLSSMITWFFLKGWDQTGPILDTIADLFITTVIVFSLTPLVKDGMLYIFQVPLFWIAGGTLFYLLLSLLLSWIVPGVDTAESSLFLLIGALIRFAMYTAAVLTGRPAS